MNRVERLIRNADLALYRLTHAAAAAAAVATHKTHKEKTPSFSVCIIKGREAKNTLNVVVVVVGNIDVGGIKMKAKRRR